MRSRPGFARRMPLAVLAGLAAGTIALLASARPVQAPGTPLQLRPERPELARLGDGGCSDVPAPVPAHGIMDSNGRRWELADLPGHTLRGLDVRNAEWAGADLHGSAFIECDFRKVDLSGACLHHTSFKRCRLEDARLDHAHIGDTSFVDCRLCGTKMWTNRFGVCLGEWDLKPRERLTIGEDGITEGLSDTPR